MGIIWAVPTTTAAIIIMLAKQTNKNVDELNMVIERKKEERNRQIECSKESTKVLKSSKKDNLYRNKIIKNGMGKF